MINPDLFGNISGIGGEKTYAVDGATRANVNPSLGLSVADSDKDKVIETVQGGSTAYSDHVVTIGGVELANYTLSMSSSSSSLTKPSGTSGANITGAGGVTGNSMPANRWGYAVAEESASDSSYGELTYNTVPTTASKIAEGNAAADGTLSVKKKIVISARFGEDAAPGTYRQTINLSAVANPTTVTFKITYNSNGGGTAPAAVAQNSMENSVSFTLAGQGSMSKSGYKFIGWSTSSTATTGSAAGSSYTVNRTQPQVTLYAVWQVDGAQWSNGVSSGITNMQDISSGFCKNNSNIVAGDTIRLKDSRDPNSYTIVKLEDGNCWMQENLRLAGGKTLKPSDSNVSSDWPMPATLTSLSSTDFDSSSDYGATSYYTIDTLATNGVYYSFTAATAGAFNRNFAYGDIVGGTNGNSVCPLGWKLPTNSEFNSMLTAADISNNTDGSTKIRGDKYKFLYAGLVRSGSLLSVNSSGDYWSRTASGGAYAFTLGIGAAQVSMYDGAHYFGYSVRCVANY